VVTLRVAVNERFKQQDGEWGDRANYFDVTVWGASAESCAQYLSRGRPVLVEGRLRWSEWTDKEGNKRQGVSVTASQVVFLRGKDDNGGGQQAQTQTQQAQQTAQQTQAQAHPPDETQSVPADTSGMGGSTETADDDIPF
jgi:single-strand DNA-binding protein